MKTKKRSALLGLISGLLLLAAGISASQAAVISRTPWEMNRGGSWSLLGFTLPSHGYITAYNNASIPATSDLGWGPAPNPDTIGFVERSILPGYCLQAVDYTYFQTFVTVPADATVATFTIAFSGIDDGGRVTIFNSANPSGLVVPGSYVYLGGSGTANLASYVTTGQNRVVVTQVDDCPVGNNLRVGQVVLDGVVIPPSIIDTDGDGVPDDTDVCPLDVTNDVDEDGICGGVDNCPTVANQDQADTDNDGTGNACNEGVDDDGDEWNNELDNCPIVANPDQLDTDGDNMGDACDTCPLDEHNDADADGFCANVDNCPVVSNPDQLNTDTDLKGDACDDDDDDDGIIDALDNCPLISNADQLDFDHDGQGDACDADDDGDNVNDAVDACLDTLPGAVVNSAGCAIEQLCACDSTWKNHGAYVSCVAHATNDFVSGGLLTATEKGAIDSTAGKSACGAKK